jgi:DNA replication protein DnaC
MEHRTPSLARRVVCSDAYEEAVQKKQSHLSYLEALLEAEVEQRDRRAVLRRIKEAHLPAVKTLEEFDFQSAPHLPVALIKKLSDGQYLERKEPVIFLGETGTGKSHLAVALAVAACRQSKRVRLRAESRSLCASVGNQGAAVL